MDADAAALRAAFDQGADLPAPLRCAAGSRHQQPGARAAGTHPTVLPAVTPFRPLPRLTHDDRGGNPGRRRGDKPFELPGSQRLSGRTANNGRVNRLRSDEAMSCVTVAELVEMVPDLRAMAGVEASAEVRAAMTRLADRYAAMAEDGQNLSCEPMIQAFAA